MTSPAWLLFVLALSSFQTTISAWPAQCAERTGAEWFELALWHYEYQCVQSARFHAYICTSPAQKRNWRLEFDEFDGENARMIASHRFANGEALGPWHVTTAYVCTCDRGCQLHE